MEVVGGTQSSSSGGKPGIQVDVVIPVHNGRATLRDAVESVLGQSYPDLIVTVVDDGSTDGSLEVLAGLSDSRLHRVAIEKSGVTRARNVGIERTTGEFVAFLDCDDIAQLDWLQTLVGLADGADLVGCGARLVRPGSPDRLKQPTPDSTGSACPVFLAGMFMVRRDLLDLVGGYDEQLSRSENTELGFRLMRQVERDDRRIRVTKAPLVTIHRASEQATKYSPATKRHAAEVILRKNPDWRAQNRRLAGTYHAVAGYGALQQDDRAAARAHLGSAVRLYPTKARYWLLLLRAWKPRDPKPRY